MSQFNATFSNAEGIYRTVLLYDKGVFSMHFADMRFEGDCLEEMQLRTKPAALFPKMREGELLRNFQLIFKMPLQQASAEEFLTVKVKINQENKLRRIAHIFEAQLYTDSYVFKTTELHNSLRSTLAEIKRQLPYGYPFHICFFCAFADFHPQQEAAFGKMLCFKEQAEAYLQSEYREDIELLLEQSPSPTTELSVCDTFCERAPEQDFIV